MMSESDSEEVSYYGPDVASPPARPTAARGVNR